MTRVVDNTDLEKPFESELSSTSGNSQTVDVNPADLIVDLEALKETRIKTWNNFFDKYTNIKSSSPSIPVEDCSLYYNDEDNISIILSSYCKVSINEVEDKLEKTSKVQKDLLPKSAMNDFQNRHFLSSWTTSNELRFIYRDFMSRKISLHRLRKLIELTFKSKLKDLLALREEARILKLRKLDKYDKEAKHEVRRLMKYINKKYIVIYVVLYKCDISLVELVKMMNETHNCKLGALLKNNSTYKNHKLLTKEWMRLRKVLPREYLVEYCQAIQLNEITPNLSPMV